MRRVCLVMLLASAGLLAQAALSDAEREFQQAMAGVTLEGHSSMDGREGVSEDRYEIEKIEKQADGNWLFYVKVNFQGSQMTVPFPIAVEWAGDTPVITLTDQQLPGRGTYTARVLVYRGHYAGTWSGGDRGGKVFGQVVKAAQ